MRKAALIFFVLFLTPLCLWGGLGEDDGGFVVAEEDEIVPPDPLRQAWALMSAMTDEQKIYQLFIVSPEQLTQEKHTTAWPKENVLSSRPVGGVMIFGQNIVDEAQCAGMIRDIQSQAGKSRLFPLWIATEEEGGANSRVANKLGYDYADAPEEIGKTGSAELAWAAGEKIAAYLKPLGFNLTFAPTADTVKGQEQAACQLYGEEPALVSLLAGAMAEGLRNGGITPCYTHFPGFGPMRGNTLKALSIRRLPEEMKAREWIPFRDGIRAQIEMIQVSHGIVRSVGDDMPASVSNVVINGLLRQELGYQGVVATDSLRMSAVTDQYKTGQESLAALKAGADILLLPPDLDAAVRAIRRAVETHELTMERVEESVQRILAVKIRMGLIQ